MPIELEYDIRSAAPPWESGTLLEVAGRVLATQEEGDLMGGPRFEQLFRATGTLRVGDDEYSLNGGGLRIRRAGVRRLAAFRGHVWQSTVFPSGRALRALPLSAARRRQGHVQRGLPVRGRRRADPRVGHRRAVAALRSRPRARTPRSRSRPRTAAPRRSQGTTVLSTCMVMSAASAGNEAAGRGMGNFRLQQAVCQYEWDGESATGMIERSSASSDVS